MIQEMIKSKLGNDFDDEDYEYEGQQQKQSPIIKNQKYNEDEMNDFEIKP